VRTRLLLAAATQWRTLIILGAGVVASAVLSNPFPAVIALGVYLWALQKLALSPDFQAAGERVRVAEAMAERYRSLQQTAVQVTNLLQMNPVMYPAGGGQWRPWLERVNELLTAARSIYQEWLSHKEQDEARTQMVQEGLRLADLYLKIVRAYQAVYMQPRQSMDLRSVRERLQRNRQKLEESHDLEARHMLAQAIEMDERVLGQAEDQETEKERYQARLAAIESAMDLLRRRLYDPEVGGEGTGLHDLLLEAEAMDEALTEVQRHTRQRA
jgi:hypothetical protein